MYEPRKKVFWFAIGSRVIIIILQFVFNILCPDHDSDGFRSPIDDTANVSSFDELINFALRGLTRWDGQYFIHIAEYGYTYENTLAFYPLFPLIVRAIAICLKSICFMLNIRSCIIIASVSLNFLCFVKSAVIFYDLSEFVLKRTNIAYKAAILYCINPASIFFSAVYTESLFAYLTFYSMLASLKLDPYVAFPLALSILVRSNGIVNLGFPVYSHIKNLSYTFVTKYKCSSRMFARFLFSAGTLRNCSSLLNTVIIALAPFFLLQIYNYITFCISQSHESALPVYITNYAIINNLILQGNGNAEWCNSSLPLAYSYVQRKYWNVGFLKYYEFKQIPNFCLALPILCIMTVCIKEYIYEHKSYFCTLGFSDSATEVKSNEVKKYPKEILVFIVHGLFLTIFCLFFMHIQVSTRLLCSASPLLFWYCALTMSHKHSYTRKRKYSNRDDYLESDLSFFPKRQYLLIDKFILSYFLGYIMVGCFMFSNFLPWT